MGLFSKDAAAQKAALAELRAAREELHSMEPRAEEDDEFDEKNARVIRAEKNVPWYRR